MPKKSPTCSPIPSLNIQHQIFFSLVQFQVLESEFLCSHKAITSVLQSYDALSSNDGAIFAF